MDLEDLHDFLESGMPVAEIAEYLCREGGEVEAKEVEAKTDEVERQIAASVRL
jgi:hypothetical protein